MKQGQVIEIEIPGSAEFIILARQAVEGIGKRLKFSDDELEDIKIAVGEACTNAVKHGKSPTGECSVQIKCKILNNGLSVEITNDVMDFCMPTVPVVPDTTKSNGYGLFIINGFMDEFNMTHKNGTATVKMIKKKKMLS